MKKVIIGIHGLGNKPKKDLLQKWWEESMLEGLRLIGEDKILPTFEIAYWADILHQELLDESVKDKNHPLFIEGPYTQEPPNTAIIHHSFRQKIIDFVTRKLKNIFLNGDNTLNYSFIADALLKRYFSDLEAYYSEECIDPDKTVCRAKELIRERIENTIRKYPNHEIMIVAHSMGSIVAFDVLNFLIPDTKINSLVTIGSPLGLPMIVSKIADEQKQFLIGGEIMDAPPGITSNWFNLADIMDNVALDYKLADDFLANENGIAPVDFLVHNNYEFNGVQNPHKSYGYLRTPEFAKILRDFIGDAEQNVGQKILRGVVAVIKKVKEKGDLVKGKLKRI